MEQALGTNATVELISTNAPAVDLVFHRNRMAGLGYEVLVPEDLETWESYTKYYDFTEPAPPSDLGEDYEEVLLEPRSTLPKILYYKVNVHAY